PDITVLAKAIGGGMPLAAFGASADIMEELNSLRVIHVGTYASNPITLAAAEVTLKEILTDEAYRRVFALNRRLVDGYSRLIREHGLPCYANGVGSMGTINFRKDVLRDYRTGPPSTSTPRRPGTWRCSTRESSHSHPAPTSSGPSRCSTPRPTSRRTSRRS